MNTSYLSLLNRRVASAMDQHNDPPPNANALVQIKHGANVLIQGGQFVQHNQPSAAHNCYDARGMISMK